MSLGLWMENTQGCFQRANSMSTESKIMEIHALGNPKGYGDLAKQTVVRFQNGTLQLLDNETFIPLKTWIVQAEQVISVNMGNRYSLCMIVVDGRICIKNISLLSEDKEDNEALQEKLIGAGHKLLSGGYSEPCSLILCRNDIKSKSIAWSLGIVRKSKDMLEDLVLNRKFNDAISHAAKHCREKLPYICMMKLSHLQNTLAASTKLTEIDDEAFKEITSCIRELASIKSKSACEKALLTCLEFSHPCSFWQYRDLLSIASEFCRLSSPEVRIKYEDGKRKFQTFCGFIKPESFRINQWQAFRTVCSFEVIVLN